MALEYDLLLPCCCKEAKCQIRAKGSAWPSYARAGRRWSNSGVGSNGSTETTYHGNT